MNRVPIEEFGKDHWSLFAYVALRCLDYQGGLDRRHLRLDGCKYPTRTRNGEIPGHDDMDCLDDLEAAGLCANSGTGLHPVMRMTDLGLAVFSQILRHKGDGGNYADFVPVAPVQKASA